MNHGVNIIPHGWKTWKSWNYCGHPEARPVNFTKSICSGGWLWLSIFRGPNVLDTSTTVAGYPRTRQQVTVWIDFELETVQLRLALTCGLQDKCSPDFWGTTPCFRTNTARLWPQKHVDAGPMALHSKPLSAWKLVQPSPAQCLRRIFFWTINWGGWSRNNEKILRHLMPL